MNFTPTFTELKKFGHPELTAAGEPRAKVSASKLTELWFNTGTLCNIECPTCYIQSGPKKGTHDHLVFITLRDVEQCMAEIKANPVELPVRKICFIGGEPFMNPYFMAILQYVLEHPLEFEVLILTNAMFPMQHVLGNKKIGGNAHGPIEVPKPLTKIISRYRDRITFRVSFDSPDPAVHDHMRPSPKGNSSFALAYAGVQILLYHRAHVTIAGRATMVYDQVAAIEAYQKTFDSLVVPGAPVPSYPRFDCSAPGAILFLPEINTPDDPTEISEGCWEVLGVSSSDQMCSYARMVVRRRGESMLRVLACTIIYGEDDQSKQFELGATLLESLQPVSLNHPDCFRFCVGGGGKCGG